MNNVDHDPKIASKDAYGNVSAQQFSNQSPEAHGFCDVPEECEDSECAECPLDILDRAKRDCPYIRPVPDKSKIVLTANDKLDIALAILTERQVEEFANICAERENS